MITIRLEEVKQTDGSVNYDLVMCQGDQKIRMGLLECSQAKTVAVANHICQVIEGYVLDEIVVSEGGAA